MRGYLPAASSDPRSFETGGGTVRINTTPKSSDEAFAKGWFSTAAADASDCLSAVKQMTGSCLSFSRLKKKEHADGLANIVELWYVYISNNRKRVSEHAICQCEMYKLRWGAAGGFFEESRCLSVL
jgi:hypothetical protein